MDNLHDINEYPIGIFDSGIGGLTVVREVMRQIPDESIVYFGDTARVPYGSKSQKTIIHYTEQILRFLTEKKVKAIVVACNTVSAYALEEVREKVNVPIIGVVRPGAGVAAYVTKNKKIGVIGTEGTVKSGLYEKCIRELRPDAEVYSKACPLFVPLVEEGWWHGDITEEIALRYLSELKEKNIDTLIMGCTHYPLLRKTLRKVLGEKVELVNPAYETAVELKRLLENRELLKTSGNGKKPSYEFFVSDDPVRFTEFANSVLNFEISGTGKIDIEQY